MDTYDNDLGVKVENFKDRKRWFFHIKCFLAYAPIIAIIVYCAGAWHSEYASVGLFIICIIGGGFAHKMDLDAYNTELNDYCDYYEDEINQGSNPRDDEFRI